MTEEAWDHCCPWASAAGEWKKEEGTELPREDSRGEESQKASVEDGEPDPAKDATPNAFPEGELTQEANVPETVPEESPQRSETAPLAEDESEPEPKSTDASSTSDTEVGSEIGIESGDSEEALGGSSDDEIPGDDIDTDSGESPWLSDVASSHTDETTEAVGVPDMESEAASVASLVPLIDDEPEPESMGASSTSDAEVGSEVAIESADAEEALGRFSDDEIACDEAEVEVETVSGESPQPLAVVPGQTDGFSETAEVIAEDREPEVASVAPLIEDESEPESTDTPSTLDAEEALRSISDDEVAGGEIETVSGESPLQSDVISNHADETTEAAGVPDMESEAVSVAPLVPLIDDEPEPESMGASSTSDAEVGSEVAIESADAEEALGHTSGDESADTGVETGFGESSQLLAVAPGQTDGFSETAEVVAEDREPEVASVAPLIEDESKPESTDTPSTLDAEVGGDVVSVDAEGALGSISDDEISGDEIEAVSGQSPLRLDVASSPKDETTEAAGVPDIESEAVSVASSVVPLVPLTEEESEPEPESTDTPLTSDAEVGSEIVIESADAEEALGQTSGDESADAETGFGESSQPLAVAPGQTAEVISEDSELEVASVKPIVPLIEDEPESESSGSSSTDTEQASESALEEVPELSSGEIQATLEAVLYAAGEPLTLREMKKILSDVPPERVKQGIEGLLETYGREGKGLHILQVAGGYQVTTRPEYHERVSAMFKARPPTKLSIQALETLASIAYRQPVTVPEIMELRGVRSAGVVRTLLERKLIRIVGRKNVVGRPILYGTTKDFLVRFGLKNLDELPRLEDMADVFGEEVSLPVDETNGDGILPVSESEETAIPEAVGDGSQEDLDGLSSEPTGEASMDPEGPNRERDPLN